MIKHKHRRKVTIVLAALMFFASVPLELIAEELTTQSSSDYLLHENYYHFPDVPSLDPPYNLENDSGDNSENFEETYLETQYTTEQLNSLYFDQSLDTSRHGSGLIGFYGPNALTYDDTLVPIIAVFNQDPISVQLARAAERGITPFFDAPSLVESEWQLFYTELNQLSISPFQNDLSTRNNSNTVTITHEFSQAFNGVSMTVPSHMVPYIGAFQSVAMVFPNEILQLDPIIIDTHPIEEDLLAFGGSTPSGVRLGRERMNAHILHEMGIRGEGVLMAILDTGLYYYHPTFEGSFPTAADMAARGVTIPDEYLLYLEGQGYFFVGRDMLHTLHGGIWMNSERGNDPMETSPMIFPNSQPNQWSNHGTHVAATAIGRETAGMKGIAPEALAIHYRVLGPGGGTSADIIAAMEHAAYYMGADVINLSLGPGGFTPLLNPTTIATNNLSMSTDAIFVFAAGNSGPNYNTTWGGGNSSFAINVANFAETPYRGTIDFSSNSVNRGELSFFS